MLPSLLNLVVVWIPYLHTLLILTNHSGGPVLGMWAGLFVCLMPGYGFVFFSGRVFGCPVYGVVLS